MSSRAQFLPPGSKPPPANVTSRRGSVFGGRPKETPPPPPPPAPVVDEDEFEDARTILEFGDEENGIPEVAPLAKAIKANRPAPAGDDRDDEPAKGAFIPQASPDHRTSIEQLDPSELTYDPELQRPVQEDEVAKIMRNFDANALGALAAARLVDEDGRVTYILLDGLQRHTAVTRLGFTEPLTVVVHHNLSTQDAARLFRLLNDRKNISPIDQFRLALMEGIPEVLAASRVLKHLDIPFGSKGGVTAASTLRRLAARRNGEVILTWALAQIQSIYATDESHNARAYDAVVIEAFFMLYERLGNQVRTDRLKAKLISYPHGVQGLRNHAVAIKSLHRIGAEWMNVYDAIVSRYNGNLSPGSHTALPLWDRQRSKRSVHTPKK